VIVGRHIRIVCTVSKIVADIAVVGPQEVRFPEVTMYVRFLMFHAKAQRRGGMGIARETGKRWELRIDE
jgi:hypothetical protein